MVVIKEQQHAYLYASVLTGLLLHLFLRVSIAEDLLQFFMGRQT